MPLLRLLRELRRARPWLRYLVGVWITAVALAVTALAQAVTDHPVSSPLFAATLVIAWLVGLGPAAVAAVGGAVLIDRIHDPSFAGRPALGNLPWIVLVVTTGLGMAWAASAIRRLEDVRGELLERERHARLAAEAAHRAKDDFLAIISHELRNPLTAILGWLHVLRRAPGHAPDAARALETIERSTLLQARLVNDLLDVSRAAACTLHMVTRDVDLSAMVTETVHMLAPDAQAAGLMLETAVEGDLRVHGDEPRLQQVVINLVSNAIKFTPAGGRIRVELSGGEGLARLVVADSGVGIEADALPHVFDRFYQAEGGRRRRDGLGLGLAIGKHIVDLHRGSIAVDSRGPGQGAAFTVTLPLGARRSAGEPSAPERRCA